ncbi:MAG: hypothetical protein WKG07_04425 [Hymenobacter sp.]
MLGLLTGIGWLFSARIGEQVRAAASRAASRPCADRAGAGKAPHDLGPVAEPAKTLILPSLVGRRLAVAGPGHGYLFDYALACWPTTYVIVFLALFIAHSASSSTGRAW